ncbi:MAG: UDP-3-O-acyl-N-acetylglucosamine deacetylase [Gomphosphaeria aponina SAG 52.96 = DSM 107014]|uniref:UDP-3-O-acyl-N-acetylglucosamine deacetylase n=1 Tax=Gomphosphaeria aponina SAG 52.96 = DSM 107014 TaxID=1521640 RepID=A0A941JTK3_9CHRO|nr:UDP-3-O-acyl-N-acetylglucosamine deacetylase [Gomphosphaeria aponina SAG 52.96 = DSM 107014]
MVKGEDFEVEGVGLHSGVPVKVRVLPAAVGEGRFFVRVDLPGKPVIPARIDSVRETTLSTELATEWASVKTVEHLLAALVASGVVDACIEIDGPEVPLLDGSAKDWVEAINLRGNALAMGAVKEPIWVRSGDAFVAALPAEGMRFTYGIDFAVAAIGNQWYSWSPMVESFAAAIAPARTFVLAEQVEQLRSLGLIKGGTLDNALVCSGEGWLNPPLRFTNEPVRHKILDLVGDLSLLGKIPVAHFLAYKAGHNLHIQLARKLSMVNG